MPVRPPGLIRQTIGDNVQQVDQAPTVTGEEQFFSSIEEVVDESVFGTTTSNVTITSNMVFSLKKDSEAGGAIGGSGDIPRYVLGDSDGNVYTIDADDGTTIHTNSPTSSPIVSVETLGGRNQFVAALSEDGNLYGVSPSTGTEWTFTVGGTPECLIHSEDESNTLYVGQPPGQSNEFYSLSAGTNVSTNWTYTASGGFRGGIETDDNYVYTGAENTALKLDKSGGSADWTNSNGGPDEDLTGTIHVDEDNAYFAFVNANQSHYLQAIDKSSASGSEVWNEDRFIGNTSDIWRANVVGGEGAIYFYPTSANTLGAFSKADGSTEWTYSDVDPLGDNSGNRIETNVVDAGNSVFITAGPVSSSPPGDIISAQKTNGDQEFTADLNGDGVLPLVSHGKFVSVVSSSGDIRKYNVATEGTFGPTRVGSRPFATLGADSVGQFDVIVKGKNDETGTALEQDTLTFDGGTQAEQLPWWSWEYAEFEIDDKNATAGDTTLYFSASR